MEVHKYEKINFLSLPSKEEIFIKKGFKWDKTNKREHIFFLKEKLKVDNVYPHSFFPWTYYWKENKHFMNIKVNKKLFSLTNVAKSTIILCKDSGVWNYYNSDKYGFHNPKNVITNDKLGYVILLGDSFTEGSCVKSGDDIGNQLRKLNYNIINLGKSPGGAIHANAIYREYKNYIKKENPVVVIYLMYGENDIGDTAKENNIPVLRNYFINSDYSNNLINKQYEIDELWKRVKHIVKCCFNGRRIVIFSGGEAKNDEELINEIKAINKGGGFGSIIGRNSFQRPKQKAIQLISDITDIYKGK